MAGVSTKDIKTRIRSMESTKQITKAMEMVASSKLRHAQERVTNARPYFEVLQETLSDIAGAQTDFSSVYLTRRPVKKTLYVVVGGDRGLAGGYNSNVLKLATEEMAEKQSLVLPLGKKALDYFQSHGFALLSGAYTNAAQITVGDCFSIAKQLCQMFASGEVDELVFVYTRFDSVLSQTPMLLPVLPLKPQENKEPAKLTDIVYEPGSEEVFHTIIPEYVGGLLYGALCESRASEHAARRTAMDAATQNAQDMIEQLSLKFNQARQAAITQEITEIVAGS